MRVPLLWLREYCNPDMDVQAADGSGHGVAEQVAGRAHHPHPNGSSVQGRAEWLAYDD